MTPSKQPLPQALLASTVWAGIPLDPAHAADRHLTTHALTRGLTRPPTDHELQALLGEGRVQNLEFTARLLTCQSVLNPANERLVLGLLNLFFQRPTPLTPDSARYDWSKVQSFPSIPTISTNFRNTEHRILTTICTDLILIQVWPWLSPILKTAWRQFIEIYYPWALDLYALIDHDPTFPKTRRSPHTLPLLELSRWTPQEQADWIRQHHGWHDTPNLAWLAYLCHLPDQVLSLLATHPIPIPALLLHPHCPPSMQHAILTYYRQRKRAPIYAQILNGIIWAPLDLTPETHPEWTATHYCNLWSAFSLLYPSQTPQLLTPHPEEQQTAAIFARAALTSHSKFSTGTLTTLRQWLTKRQDRRGLR